MACSIPRRKRVSSSANVKVPDRFRQRPGNDTFTSTAQFPGRGERRNIVLNVSG
jgi:hypothetical protein